MKVIRVNTPNGLFGIPLESVAKHRADYYVGADNVDTDEYNQELQYIINDHDEGIDWLINSTDWSDWADTSFYLGKGIEVTQDSFWKSPSDFKVVDYSPIEDSYNFTLHVPNLIKEIVDCGLDQRQGILLKPIEMFRKYLYGIAERCSQINDPILNKMMCDLALYSQADPQCDNYDQSMIDQVNDNYQKYIQK